MAAAAGDSYNGALNEYYFAKAVKYYELAQGNLINAEVMDGHLQNGLYIRLVASGYFGAEEQANVIVEAGGTDIVDAGLSSLGGAGAAVIVGGGASIENISEVARWRIQKFADEYDVDVAVVGSRVDGTSNELSDWDYVISGNSKIRSYARDQLPRGIAGGEIGWKGETGMDVLNGNKTPLDPNKPFILFTPQK